MHEYSWKCVFWWWFWWFRPISSRFLAMLPDVKDCPQMGFQKSSPKNQNHHEKSKCHFCPRNVPGAPRWCAVVISRWSSFSVESFSSGCYQWSSFSGSIQGQIQSMECRAPLVITNTISVLVTFEKDRVNACSLSTVFNNGTAADGQIPTCDRLSTAHSVSCQPRAWKLSIKTVQDPEWTRLAESGGNALGGPTVVSSGQTISESPYVTVLVLQHDSKRRTRFSRKQESFRVQTHPLRRKLTIVGHFVYTFHR